MIIQNCELHELHEWVTQNYELCELHEWLNRQDKQLIKHLIYS